MRKANKEHQCARGCSIKNGEYYFIKSGESIDGLKMCARCMAMVLYFKYVGKLKPCEYLGWDPRHREPKHSEKSALFTGQL